MAGKSGGRSQSSTGQWNCKSQPRQAGTAKVAKRNGKIPSRLLQIPGGGGKVPSRSCREQEATIGAISSAVPPCAQQLPRAHLAPFTHLSRQISRFHSLLLANGNVVNSPGIIHAVENNHPRSPMSCQGGGVTHPRGSLLPQWSKQSKSDGRNKEMRLISLKG